MLFSPTPCLAPSALGEIRLAREIIQEQKAAGKLVVLSCHDRGQLENLSDIIVKMQDGHIREVIAS